MNLFLLIGTSGGQFYGTNDTIFFAAFIIFIFEAIRQNDNSFLNKVLLFSSSLVFILSRPHFIIYSFSFMWIDNKQECLLNVTKYLKNKGYILILEPMKFLFLEKKFQNQKNKMISTLETLVKSKKLTLIHFGFLHKGVFFYLLKN